MLNCSQAVSKYSITFSINDTCSNYHVDWSHVMRFRSFIHFTSLVKSVRICVIVEYYGFSLFIVLIIMKYGLWKCLIFFLFNLINFHICFSIIFDVSEYSACFFTFTNFLIAHLECSLYMVTLTRIGVWWYFLSIPDYLKKM